MIDDFSGPRPNSVNYVTRSGRGGVLVRVNNGRLVEISSELKKNDLTLRQSTHIELVDSQGRLWANYEDSLTCSRSPGRR